MKRLLRWPSLALGGLADFVMGQAPPGHSYNTDGMGTPFVRAGEFGPLRPGISHWTTAPLKHARDSDVLVCVVGATAGKVNLGVDAAIGRSVAAVRPRPGLDQRFLYHFLSAHVQALRSGSRGSAQGVIARRDLQELAVPLPPLEEQRRIVDILEDHLSRLDAAGAYLDAALRRHRSLVASVLTATVPDLADYPAHWRSVTVADAGHLELGRQRHPDWHHGPDMHPYLRVANVFEDRIDASDLKEMHWPGGTFERFRLHPGDVLLNEGQSPEWLGRPAIYRGMPPDVAFTNSLLRFVASAEVLPEFALLVFRRHMHAGRFRRESRITTNIAHLSANRLKSVEFPIPPLPEQERFVEDVAVRLDAVAVVIEQVQTAQARARSLRRALLAAAFSGRLTGRASDMDLAEELVS